MAAKKETLMLPILLLNLYIPIFFLLSPSLCDTNPGDAAVMRSLAKSLKPLPTGWSTDPASDPCGKTPRWDGVFCDSGRVTRINLQSRSISGNLPPDLNTLSSLRGISLQNNQLSGDLPTLENLSSLEEIFFNNNSFKSVPPTFFSGLSGLTNVSLDDNPFSSWSIPDDLSLSSNLVDFSAMNASIFGSIPDFFGGMINLLSLRLSYNHLVGGIPTSFWSSGIRYLYLNNQELNGNASTGKLSGLLDVLGSMNQLTVAWLHSNNFIGPIPDLSNCTSLTDLQLRDNHLTGIVPPSVALLPRLMSITLANNNLQGPCPNIAALKKDDRVGNSFCNVQPGPCDQRVMQLLSVAKDFGYPMKLAQSWKGNDPCSNAWPSVSCDSQGNIITLNFANQKLVGTISPDIANFTLLKNLVLSNNGLTGVIPESLTRLAQLRVLDVSNNNLTGKIPAFGSDVKVISDGNPLIGKDVGSGGFVPTPSEPSQPSPNGSPSGASHSMSTGQIVLIVLGTLAFIIILAAFVYYRQRLIHAPKFGKVQTHSPPNGPELLKIGMAGLSGNGGFTSELYSQSSGDNGNAHVIEVQSMFVSIQALQQATNNFSERNILGRGGFGVVYSGEQPDGTMIAVKRMECNVMGNKGMSEFQAEIAVLTKVRHRHLVALLGYCVDGNERLLVYEYMPQGTLGQHLFGGNEGVYPSLSWKQRLTIALDVARGLEYLHSLAQKSFIHRDLKPSNILLDNDMRAKVSDFGLVKLAPDGKNSVETRLAGTFGYLAPEYATTGRVTTKVDVYAFGVVLMELITGRRALDESLPDESAHLVSWFRRVIINKDNIKKCVDPTLDLDKEALDSVSTVAELAGHCTARESHQRPDMGHVVNILAPLVDKWKPSRSNEEDSCNNGFKESLTQRLQRWKDNEGTSMMEFDLDNHLATSFETTQGGIPTKPTRFRMADEEIEDNL